MDYKKNKSKMLSSDTFEMLSSDTFEMLSSDTFEMLSSDTFEMFSSIISDKLNLNNKLNKIISKIKNEFLRNDFYIFLESPNQKNFNAIKYGALRYRDSWAVCAIAMICENGLFGVEKDSKQAIEWYKTALDFNDYDTTLTGIIVGKVGTLFNYNPDLNGEKEFLYSTFDLLVKNNDYINSYTLYKDNLKIMSLKERNEFLSTIEKIIEEAKDSLYSEFIEEERKELNALTPQNTEINQESNGEISTNTTENNDRSEQLKKLKITNSIFFEKAIDDTETQINNPDNIKIIEENYQDFELELNNSYINSLF